MFILNCAESYEATYEKLYESTIAKIRVYISAIKSAQKALRSGESRVEIQTIQRMQRSQQSQLR